VNPHSVASSMHVVHILAVAGSLMLLIGSAGQAWDSLQGFQAEFQMFANELGESFRERGGLVMEIGRRLSELPLDEIAAGGYILASCVLFLFFAVRNWFRTRIKRWRSSTERNIQAVLPPEQEIAQKRLRALLRTALNWTFIMLGAIVVLIGATIDLITSW
jgi:hypothetical protein